MNNWLNESTIKTLGTSLINSPMSPFSLGERVVCAVVIICGSVNLILLYMCRSEYQPKGIHGKGEGCILSAPPLQNKGNCPL